MPYKVDISITIEDEAVITPEQAARTALDMIGESKNQYFNVTDLDTEVETRVDFDHGENGE